MLDLPERMLGLKHVCQVPMLSTFQYSAYYSNLACLLLLVVTQSVPAPPPPVVPSILAEAQGSLG